VSIEELQASLTRKQEIDALKANQQQFVETHRWLVSAVELLLRIEITREQRKGRSREHESC
jgi:hypothetical protein